MKQWWKDGEHLILCLDANENIYRGELGWQLTELDGLGMKEVVGEFTARQLGATNFVEANLSMGSGPPATSP